MRFFNRPNKTFREQLCHLMKDESAERQCLVLQYQAESWCIERSGLSRHVSEIKEYATRRKIALSHLSIIAAACIAAETNVRNMFINVEAGFRQSLLEQHQLQSEEIMGRKKINDAQKICFSRLQKISKLKKSASTSDEWEMIPKLPTAAKKGKKQDGKWCVLPREEESGYESSSEQSGSGEFNSGTGFRGMRRNLRTK